MRIFRIESIHDGKGPYVGRSVNWTEERHDETTGRPEPEDDWIDYTNNHIFGFRSTKQLKQWFSTTERQTLVELGYRVRVYNINISKIIFGNYQVAFIKPN